VPPPPLFIMSPEESEDCLRQRSAALGIPLGISVFDIDDTLVRASDGRAIAPMLELAHALLARRVSVHLVTGRLDDPGGVMRASTIAQLQAVGLRKGSHWDSLVLAPPAARTTMSRLSQWKREQRARIVAEVRAAAVAALTASAQRSESSASASAMGALQLQQQQRSSRGGSSFHGGAPQLGGVGPGGGSPQPSSPARLSDSPAGAGSAGSGSCSFSSSSPPSAPQPALPLPVLLLSVGDQWGDLMPLGTDFDITALDAALALAQPAAAGAAAAHAAPAPQQQQASPGGSFPLARALFSMGGAGAGGAGGAGVGGSSRGSAASGSGAASLGGLRAGYGQLAGSAEQRRRMPFAVIPLKDHSAAAASAATAGAAAAAQAAATAQLAGSSAGGGGGGAGGGAAAGASAASPLSAALHTLRLRMSPGPAAGSAGSAGSAPPPTFSGFGCVSPYDPLPSPGVFPSAYLSPAAAASASSGDRELCNAATAAAAAAVAAAGAGAGAGPTPAFSRYGGGMSDGGAAERTGSPYSRGSSPFQAGGTGEIDAELGRPIWGIKLPIAEPGM
jgi:hypothetical protein